jgi:hypothetical protein
VSWAEPMGSPGENLRWFFGAVWARRRGWETENLET